MKRRWLAIAAGLTSTMTLIVLLSLLGRACPDVSPSVRAAAQDAPTVTGVDPASAPNDLDTPVVINGTGFVAGLSPVGSTVIVITQPTVWLGDAQLPHAAWVSSTTLTATVPWGLDPGVYTLTVANPDGQSGSLPNVFTVTQGIGVWTTGGPYGGEVSSIVINPVTPTTLYAATSSGAGLFRSRDGGENWEPVFSGMVYNGVVDIAPQSPDTVYVGSWDKGLYRSDDGGHTWIAIPITGTGGYYRPFAHPVLSETVYATVDCGPLCGGIFRSDSRGQVWVTRTNGLTDTQTLALAFDPTDPLKMYVGTVNGNVFRSVNGGESWEFIGRPGYGISELAVNPFGAHEVWAASGWGYLGKYASGSWGSMSPPGPGGVDAIAFDQHVSGTLWIGGWGWGGGLKSTDGGLTWTPFAKTPLRNGVWALAVDPTDSRIVYEGFVGDGVFKTSDDGATWQEVNHGLAGLVPNGLATVPSHPGTVYATVHGAGIFKTDNGGKSWLKLICDDTLVRSPVIDPVTSTRVYVTVINGGVDISEDGGSRWQRVDTPVPSQYADRYQIERSLLAANPKQPGHLVLGVSFIDKRVVQWSWIAGGIYTSTDYGETWSFVDVGQEISAVLALAFDPLTSAVVYAGTEARTEANTGSGIWKSTDGGATWALSGLSGLSVSGIAVDHRDSRTVYATAGGKFYVSHDAGQNWTQIADGVHSNLLYIPSDPPVLYVYGAMGMKRSMDGGQHWETPAGALAYSTIGSMAMVTTDDRVIVYVGTGGGVASSGATQTMSQASGETLVNAGVYRQTTRLLNRRVYLPLAVK